MHETLIEALTEALQDEYKARATYQAILNRFGLVRPFVNILESEKRHIQALLSLFTRYQIAVPKDLWPARVEVPTTLQQACEEGVQGEIENGAMYERLLAMTVGYPDVQRVFRQLQRASQENHLPAFQRCVHREANGIDGGDRAGSIFPGEDHSKRGRDHAQVDWGVSQTIAGQSRGRHRQRHRGNRDCRA